MTTVRKDMQLTPEEFGRRMQPVIAAYNGCPTPEGFVATDGEGTIHVSAVPGAPRRLGSFDLPRCSVEITFDGVNGDGPERFLALFDRVFRKGGG